MIGDAMYTTIKTLLQRNLNISQIANATGHDWKTIKKVAENIKAGKEHPEKQTRTKILNKNKEDIIKWIEEGLTGLRIHEKLLELGVNASYSTEVTCFLRIEI